MLWINLCAIVCLCLGFAKSWWLIRKTRLPFAVGNPVLTWEENPVSMFEHDGLLGASISFHALSIITLALLMVFSVNRLAPSPLSLEFHSPAVEMVRLLTNVEDRGLQNISWVAAVLAAGIGAYTLGAFVAFPVVRWWVRPVLVQIVPDGLIYGNTYKPWQEVAHWQVDARRRLIRLFSKTPPGAVSYVLHPAGEELFKVAEEKIRSFLPEPENDLSWRGSRKRLIFALILFSCIGLSLAIAFWAYSFRAEWVWFLYGLEIVALEMGGRYLTRL